MQVMDDGWQKLVAAVGAGIGAGLILGYWLRTGIAKQSSSVLPIEGLSEEEFQVCIKAISKETKAKLRAALRATASTSVEQDLSQRGQSLSQRICGQPFADGGLPLFLQSGEWQGNFWGQPPTNPHALILKQEQARAGVSLDLPPIQRKKIVWEWNEEYFREADSKYSVCEEALRAPEVKEGRWERFKDWSREGGVYPRIKRDISVYIPISCTDDDDERPGIIVFQDGESYNGDEVKACTVIDTLIHRHQIPKMVAVFVSPGKEVVGQRSLEYDTMSDAYVRFLDDEVLPFVEEKVGLKISKDASLRGICGVSSGGMCAFNAAFHRPNSFGRVLSHCGSFTALRGGHNYPFLVRATARKPIRVVLTTGDNDIDEMEGNFALANHTMADALRWRAYDYRYDYGSGAHSLPHGGSLFAEHLRWLFRDESL